jgi:Ca2+-binding RTX toxin-like protein
MQSLFGRQFGIVRADRVGRNPKARPRRLEPSVDGLERRELLTGGAVAQSGGEVIVTPAPTGPNTVTISYHSEGSSGTAIDVNLNGTNNYFGIGTPWVGTVVFNGKGLTGAVTFTNQTDVTAVAVGGSGTNTFNGGSGVDEFIGGSGSNTFNAGSGYDILVGGSGTNVFDVSSTGSGIVDESGSQNTITDPPSSTGSYQFYSY